jgi:hypothetical protein
MVSFRRPAGVFTTKDPRHQGKNHREVREVKTFSPQRHRDGMRRPVSAESIKMAPRGTRTPRKETDREEE